MSGALVPAYAVTRSGKRMRTAYAVGRFAYQNRFKIRRAGRTILRGWRRYRTRRNKARALTRRRRIDGAAKRNIITKHFQFGTKSTESPLVRKTFYANTIRFADAPDTNGTLHEAPGMRFYVHGFKICSQFRNTSETQSNDLHMHFAIIQPKEPNATISEIKDDFFSDPENNSDRYKAFIEYGTNPNWDKNQDCLGLNTRKFNIFTHQRWSLAPINSTSVGPYYKKYEHYFPIKKNFEFENTSSSDVMMPLWICVWWESVKPVTTGEDWLSSNISTVAYISPRRTG